MILDAHRGRYLPLLLSAFVLFQTATAQTPNKTVTPVSNAWISANNTLRFTDRWGMIADVHLRSGEDAEVEAQHHRAQHAARLLELSQIALDALSESEDAAVSRLAVVGRTLQELARIDPPAQELVDLHEQSVSLLRDLQHTLTNYSERVEVEPGRLAELEQRLNLIQSLKRKYGPNLDDVLASGAAARERLAALEGREEEVDRLEGQREQLTRELLNEARALSKSRSALLPRLVKAVKAELAKANATIQPKPVGSTLLVLLPSQRLSSA